MTDDCAIKRISKYDLELRAWDMESNQQFKLTLNSEEPEESGIELCIFKPSKDIYGDVPESMIHVDKKNLQKMKEFFREACKMLDDIKD